MDAAEALAPAEGPDDGLNDREREILAFERQWWKYAGAKEQAVKELFREEQNPIAVIKWKELLDELEKATDECEDVANVLEGIVVKHS